MGLTQLQKLELNKRVDKILHSPSNKPAGNQQLEIAFVADMAGDIEEIQNSVKDAVTSLKSHDKIFQNVRSNVIYWGNNKIQTKVTPMSFIQMGKAFEDYDEDINKNNVDMSQNMEQLCGYIKLYHARCRCIIIFVDCYFDEFEKLNYKSKDTQKAVENLNPFLKYRLLVVTRDKIMSGSELMLRMMKS